MNNKVILNSLVIAGVAGSLLFGNASPVLASTSEAPKYPTLIQTIIDKFKLNKTEVDNVIFTERNTRQKARAAQVEDKLNQAVKDGKITEEAKNAILQSVKEHQAERAALANSMRTNREEHRSEMTQLGEKYGVDIHELIGSYGGYGMGNGRGMGRW